MKHFLLFEIFSIKSFKKIKKSSRTTKPTHKEKKENEVKRFDFKREMNILIQSSYDRVDSSHRNTRCKSETI